MTPKETVIELKPLKMYFYSFRDEHMSYERFINVVYDDIMDVYDPIWLFIELEFRPRGGISSILKIDSKTGWNYARKAMALCGLSLNADGVWTEDMLKDSLKTLIGNKKYRPYFLLEKPVR